MEQAEVEPREVLTFFGSSEEWNEFNKEYPHLPNSFDIKFQLATTGPRAETSKLKKEGWKEIFWGFG